MRPIPRLLLIFNTLLEIGMTLVGLFALFKLSEAYSIHPLTVWTPFSAMLAVSTALALPIYLYAVVIINLRTFPRVPYKAARNLAIFASGGAMLYFLSFNDLWLWAMVFGTQVYLSIVLSIIFGPLKESRVNILHPAVAFCFIFLGTVSLTTVGMASLEVWLGGGFPEVIAIEIWTLAFALIFLSRAFRSGWTNYAKKGYRPNVAAIIVNEHGEVLLCERADREGVIQTVQGGIDPGETPEMAIRRELKEELGIWPDQYTLVASLIGSRRYDWTVDMKERLKNTGFIGQEQYFFLAEVSSTVRFDLNYHHREFRRVWWGSPSRLLALSWAGKKPGIEAALRGFNLLNGHKPKTKPKRKQKTAS